MTDDTMRLRAEIDDQTASKLKQMQKNYKETFEELRKSQREAAKEAREHAKHQKELHERLIKVKETVSDALVPALGSLGIATYGVGEGLAKFVEKMREAGESYNKINDAAKRAGASAGFVNSMSIAFQNLGLSQDQARQSVSELGEHLDKLTRGAPDEINRMNGAFSNMGSSLNEALRGAHGREDQMERLFSFMGKQNFPMDQKRKWLEMLGIPAELASRSLKDIREAFESGFDFEKKHPTNMKVLKELDDSFTKLDLSLKGLSTDMTNAFGRPAAEMVEKFAGTIERVGEALRKYHSPDTGPFKKNSAFGFLLEKLTGIKGSDATPQSRIDNAFSAFDQGKKQKQSVKEGTKEGVLDAFREYLEGKSLLQGGAGFHLTAFNPDGGSGFADGFGGSGKGGGGLHSGGGFRVLPNGGGDMHGAPPEGSNAFNGVGGPDVAGGGGGNLGPFDRSRLIKEMNANPALRAKIMRVASNEQGQHPAGTQAVIESMFNRAIMRGTSLQKEARWTSEGGYYENGSMGRGALENAKSRAILEKSLSNVVNGADTIGLATDNSSQGLAEREAASGKFVRHRKINGESFFHPGWAEPGLARKWAKLKAEHDQFAADHPHGTRASLRDHIRHKNLLGQRSSLEGGKLTGDAHVRIDMSGAPRGTRTSAAASGMFKSVKLNRGRAMPMADGDA